MNLLASVTYDEDQLHEETNEPHDRETHYGLEANLPVFCFKERGRERQSQSQYAVRSFKTSQRHHKCSSQLRMAKNTVTAHGYKAKEPCLSSLYSLI